MLGCVLERGRCRRGARSSEGVQLSEDDRRGTAGASIITSIPLRSFEMPFTRRKSRAKTSVIVVS